MSTPSIPSFVPTLLLGLASSLACVAHDTPMAESSPPEAHDDVDTSTTTDVASRDVPVHSAPAECAPFRDPGLEEKTRRGRLAHVTEAAAKMLDDEPHVAETLLWIAELELQGGNVDDACGALRRLVDAAPEGSYTETGRCWHDHWCVAVAERACPDGFAALDHEGCAPVAACSLDTDLPIEPQVAGACERGDVACCPKEGQLAQVLHHRADRSGDLQAVAQHRRAMIELYQRSCDQGYATVCAYVAEVVREGGGEAAESDRAEELQRRACALGHRASCAE